MNIERQMRMCIYNQYSSQERILRQEKKLIWLETEILKCMYSYTLAYIYLVGLCVDRPF